MSNEQGSRPPTPGPWPLLLLPLSWLYRIGLAVYLLPYNLSIRKRHRLSCRVVSIGNLTFGGTGKSPAVRAICEGLLKRGFKPAILSRGYGGRLCKKGAIVSDGSKRFLEPFDCGDEPAAHADALPGVPVAIGKNRQKMGRLLIEQFHPDIIVLDDGMQYRQLHRDVEIVLMRADRPFGSGRLLPAGDLREPKSGIKRADAIIVTGSMISEGLRPSEEGHSGPLAPNSVDVESEMAAGDGKIANRQGAGVPLTSLPKHIEVFPSRHTPRTLVDVKTGQKLPVSTLKDMPVVAVSGIANPQSFEALLEEQRADIRARVRFGDHCPYSKKELEQIERALSSTSTHTVITTAKDAVKLRLSNMYVLDIELVIDDFDRLLDIIVGSTS